MKNIILIDLDETLLDFKADEKAALTKTLTTLGIEPSKDTLELYSRINSAQWKRLEKREITREQVKENRYRLLFEAMLGRNQRKEEESCCSIAMQSR